MNFTSGEPARTSWDVKRHIAADHPAFAGHFVGNPVLPGVVLLAEVLEVALAEPALAALLGPAPTLASAKFLAPVGPGSDLQVAWRLDARGLNFDVSCRGSSVAKGQFTRGGTP